MNSVAHVLQAPAPPKVVLSTRGLTKAFVGRTVLDSVDLDVRAGEVHALLGQNGSGKSTLIKCLAGVYRPDAGEITVGGRDVPRVFPPSAARKMGLAFVHQDLGLALDMSIADNLSLVRGFPTRGSLIISRKQNETAARILEFLDVKARPQTLVRDLPVTARTLVAIGRALDLDEPDGLNCVVLDEPTASLPDADAHLLFDAVRRLTSRGAGVIYVSHRLEEIERLASTVTVLRDGRRIGTHAMKDMTRAALVDEILGAPSPGVGRADSAPAFAPVDRSKRQAIRAERISGNRVRDVSLTIEPGEIVGIAGLGGSGRSELCRLLYGAQRLEAGRVWIGDDVVVKASPLSSIKRGMAYIPEDRRGQGCVMTLSVRENIALIRPPVRRGLIDRRRERRVVNDSITTFDVRPGDPEALVSTLSGGNQQKVVLAKWFEQKPSVIILDEPVQGVDVGAKAQIFDHLRGAAASGAAVLVVDSDFDNLTALCTRVAMLRHGEIVGELTGDAITSAAMTKATFGVSDEADHIALDELEDNS